MFFTDSNNYYLVRTNRLISKDRKNHPRVRFGKCRRGASAPSARRLLARGASLGFRVQGSGFRVQGSGLRVQGSGFRVQGSLPCYAGVPRSCENVGVGRRGAGGGPRRAISRARSAPCRAGTTPYHINPQEACSVSPDYFLETNNC